VTTRRILVVDDYAAAAQALTRLLRLSGHTVESVLTAEEAMAVALAFRPEVVLLDINLGRSRSGIAVAGWIRAEPTLHDVLLVGITGQYDIDIPRMTAAGFDHCLLKPIAFADLERIIPAADEQ
jgi:CheY-like chemotaxis protein